MQYPGFIGGSKATRSPLANNERTVNWYPEDAGDRLVLYPTPGFRAFTPIGGGVGCRALFSENDRSFLVAGANFDELTSAGQVIFRGAMDVADRFPAQIVSLGFTAGQLLVASGGDAYCYQIATQNFTKVLSGEAHMIAMLDGFFLAFNKNQNKVRFSKAIGGGGGLTWDPLDYFQRGTAPDMWRAMLVNQGRIWLIGEHTGEVWWDQGGSTPFVPIASSIFSFGIAAPWSLVSVGDTVRWLSQSEDGDGIVVSARGYRPERISDHATEYAIKQYKAAGRIDDCEALTYQDSGHTYTCLRFPTADATRVYDDATQLWHERGYWSPTQERYLRWTPRCHMLALGAQHVVGDDSTFLSVMDQSNLTEVDSSVIRRLRAAPVLHGEGERVFLDRIELWVEPGITPTSSAYYTDPQVSLALSYDGGKTWGNERFVGAGRMGEYRRRLVWTRNGSGSSVQAKFVCSDPVPWNVIDCFVDGSGFAQPRGGGTTRGNEAAA